MKRKFDHYGFATRSIHCGEEPDYREGSSGDVVAPIHLSTTYVWKDPRTPLSQFEYTRSQNPTRKAYETKLASLEQAHYAVAFASGLAAECAIVQSLLRPGDHIIAFDDLYGGTRRIFEEVFYGLEVTYADLSDIKNLTAAIRENTRMVWVESPTNPMIKVCDIGAVARITRERGLLLVVDNTFLSPYFQRPLALGADIVMHSSTKYIGGHSDVLGGVVVTDSEVLHEKIRANQNNAGAVPSPMDCYLNIRGLKTLSVRMEQHQRNALEVARYLESHPRIKRVLYPGLESHPQHLLLKSQAEGFGGMLSVELDGTAEQTIGFLTRLRLFTIAESLGGVESLIEIPAFMTHVSMDPRVRESVGIKENLIRISVGIENVCDLIDDLRQALEGI